MLSEKKRLTFAPYDTAAMKDEDKASAVAFAELREAVKTSAAKPEAPEQPGSWERTAGLHLFFSRGEVRHVETMGYRQDGSELRIPLIVLDPNGYTNVLSTESVALLQQMWNDHVKANGTRGKALRIFLTNEWLKTGVTDADDESALSTGAVILN